VNIHDARKVVIQCGGCGHPNILSLAPMWMTWFGGHGNNPVWYCQWSRGRIGGEAPCFTPLAWLLGGDLTVLEGNTRVDNTNPVPGYSISGEKLPF